MKDKEREGVAVWLDPTKPALVQPLLMLLSSVKATRFALLLFFVFFFVNLKKNINDIGAMVAFMNYELGTIAEYPKDRELRDGGRTKTHEFSEKLKTAFGKS